LLLQEVFLTEKIVNIEKNLPHKISMVVCLKCFKRWIAARPAVTKLIDIECSDCGQGFVIETGQEIE